MRFFIAETSRLHVLLQSLSERSRFAVCCLWTMVAWQKKPRGCWKLWVGLTLNLLGKVQKISGVKSFSGFLSKRDQMKKALRQLKPVLSFAFYKWDHLFWILKSIWQLLNGRKQPKHHSKLTPPHCRNSKKGIINTSIPQEGVNHYRKPRFVSFFSPRPPPPPRFVGFVFRFGRPRPSQRSSSEFKTFGSELGSPEGREKRRGSGGQNVWSFFFFLGGGRPLFFSFFKNCFSGFFFS